MDHDEETLYRPGDRSLSALRARAAQVDADVVQRVAADPDRLTGYTREEHAAANRLSYLAATCCTGMSDTGRIPATEFAAYLADHGITDPTTSTWTHTLPNGITISATLPEAASTAA